MAAYNPETPRSNFDISRLRDRNDPVPNDDPALREWVVANGTLCRNIAIIAVRRAFPGEVVKTWIKGPGGKLVLERSTPTGPGHEWVAIGANGERYTPSSESLESNKEPVGAEGLRPLEKAPSIPDDGDYTLMRPKEDFRIAADNPFTEGRIYLGTSSGRVQTGLPGGKILVKVTLEQAEAGGTHLEYGVARFLGPEEFPASYAPATADEYARLGLRPPLASGE